MTTDRLTYRHRRRGLDHDWFIHESTFKRPAIAWPGHKRIALWITVPIEFFPLDAPTLPIRPLGGLDRGYPDFWSYSNRDYGTRIGVYRIMRVLDALSLRATAAVNAVVATRYPRIIEEIVRRNWEIVANGIDMGHVHHGKLELEKERELIQKARDTLSKSSGKRIAGWHSPGHSESTNTLALLAENGFEYVTDWANDDLPYMINTKFGQLCAMPLTYEWSDRVLLVHHNLTVEDYEAQVMQAFGRLYWEAGQSGTGRILSLSVSPWILGYPHRISALARVLPRIMEVGSVWHATGVEIVAAFRSQVCHPSSQPSSKENRHGMPNHQSEINNP
jgi:peptidoglycan/xylan/chitin deacetylase (PgdA/CDA1 family)